MSTVERCPQCHGDGFITVEIPAEPLAQVGERAGDQRTSVGKRSVDVRRFSDQSLCGRLLTEWDHEPTGLTDYEATLRVVGNPGVQVSVSQWEGCRRRCSDLRAAGYLIDSGIERVGHIIWNVSPLGREAARNLRMTGWTKAAPS